MEIAVGSTRGPKVEAVKEAWRIFSKKIPGASDQQVIIAPFDIASEVPAMPLSVEQLMRGAQGRAENLEEKFKQEDNEADFYVGLEGGFNVVDGDSSPSPVFLESWAYVSNGQFGCFGHGGGIFVPPQISSSVIDHGIELGLVIDRFCKQTDIRSKQGAWGVLTSDILDRKQSFVIALIAAFAPFYNPNAFEQERPTVA